MKIIFVAGNKKGMALASVLVVFVLVGLMAVSVASMVYSDTMFSLDDENGKKAYYAARSAVETVERAVLGELAALQDEKALIVNGLREEIEALNEEYSNGFIEDANEGESLADAYARLYADIVDSYDTEILAYQGSYSSFRDNVLPGETVDSYTHTVTIEGFETSSSEFDVDITAVEDPDQTGVTAGFYLESTADVNGKTARVRKWLGIRITSEDSIVIQSLQQSDTGPNLFDNAIYSYGDLAFGNGGGGGAVAQITGGIVYEGNLYNGANVNASSVPFKQVPPTDMETIRPPADLLPYDPATIDESSTTLPTTIDQSDSAYYKNEVIINKDYTVDTSQGDVVLKMNSVLVSGSFGFHVTGTNSFYWYILDEANPGVPVVISKPANNVDAIVCDEGAEAYLIVDQLPGDYDPDDNVLNFSFGKNNVTMEAYVYAPYSTLMLKNNLDLTGSVVAGGFDIWNGSVITYHEPGTNPPLGEEELIPIDLSIALAGCDQVSYSGGSFWLKQ